MNQHTDERPQGHMKLTNEEIKMKQDIYNKRTDVIDSLREANQLVKEALESYPHISIDSKYVQRFLFPRVKVIIFDFKHAVRQHRDKFLSTYCEVRGRVIHVSNHDYSYGIDNLNRVTLLVKDTVTSKRAKEIVFEIFDENLRLITNRVNQILKDRPLVNLDLNLLPDLIGKRHLDVKIRRVVTV